MTTPACDKEFLPTLLLSGEREWIPDLLPRPDGIRFARGMLIAVVLSVPVWVLALWAVFSRL